MYITFLIPIGTAGRLRLAACLLGLIIVPAAFMRAETGDPVVERVRQLSVLIDKVFISEEESFNAIEELGTISHSESIRLLEDLLVFRWEVTPGSSALELRTRQRKLRQSKESMAKIRAKAAEALGRIGAEGSVPLLVRTVREDSNAVVREYALKALLNFDDASVQGVFEDTALHDVSENNRLLGIVGMARFPAAVTAAMAKLLIADPNVIVRVGAVKFLGSLGRKEFLPFITASAADVESMVKRRTADVLAVFKTPGTADALSYLIRDKDSGTVISAAEALGGNRSMPADEYLKITCSTFWEAALIIMKSGFNRWDELPEHAYSNLKPGLNPVLHSTADYLSRKIALRRQIRVLDSHTEKLKLSLTEWCRNSKL